MSNRVPDRVGVRNAVVTSVARSSNPSPPSGGDGTGSGSLPVVYFTDRTTGNPVAWAWTFLNSAGATLFTSALQNPSITFPNTGTYSARLIASYSNGTTSQVTHTVTVI